MATIRDIKAGLEKEGVRVSYGTISNALNGKGNVGREKLAHILAMAEKIGYKSGPTVLRTTATRIIACLLPTLENPLYQSFYQTLEQEARFNSYTVQLHLTGDSRSVEKSILGELSSTKQDALVAFSCTLEAELFRRFTCPVFLVERKVDLVGAFQVHFDYYNAGYDIGRELAGSGVSRIQLICGPLRFSSNDAFRRGLRAGIGQEENDTRLCRETEIPLYNAVRELFAVMSALPETAPDAIVCSTSQYREMLSSLFELSGTGKEIRLVAATPDAVIPDRDSLPMHYSHAASWVLRKILRQDRKAETLQVPYTGPTHWSRAPGPRADSRTVLKIMTTSIASMHQFELLAPVIRNRLGVEPEIHLYDYERLAGLAGSDDAVPDYDLVRLDVSTFPYHAARLLRPLEGFSRDRFIDELPDDYFCADGLPYAYPFNPNLMLLLYRADVFEDPLIKRCFYEKNKGRQLSPPASYAEFNHIARFLTRSLHPDSRRRAGVAYGCEACQNGLISLANQYQSRLLEDRGGYFKHNRPNLDSDGALAALERYLEIFRYAPDNRQAVEAEVFAGGTVALACTFSSSMMALSFRQDEPAFANMRLAPAPVPLRGGGILGVGRRARQPRKALELIELLTGDALAPALTKLGMYSPVKSLYRAADILHSHPVLDLLKSSFRHSVGRGIFHPCSGLPIDTGAFEAILGQEIRGVLQDGKQPAQALRDAQRRISAMPDFAGAET